MRRPTFPLALALILPALTPTAADAATITGFATGLIVSRSGPDDPAPFGRFEIDYGALLTFRFDPDTAVADGPGFSLPGSTYDLMVPGANFRSGLMSGVTPGSLVSVDGAEDRVTLTIGGERGQIELLFVDPTGAAIGGVGIPTLEELEAFPDVTLTYGSLVAFGGQGFVADMALGADTSSVPEPSTLALGVVGMGLAGLYRWRKRRCA